MGKRVEGKICAQSKIKQWPNLSGTANNWNSQLKLKTIIFPSPWRRAGVRMPENTDCKMQRCPCKRQRRKNNLYTVKKIENQKSEIYMWSIYYNFHSILTIYLRFNNNTGIQGYPVYITFYLEHYYLKNNLVDWIEHYFNCFLIKKMFFQ